MKVINKVKSFIKRGKVLMLACASAVAVAATTIAASAATAEAGNSEMQTMMTQAGDQLQGLFSTLISTIIPVVLGVLGTGLVIFGIFSLVKLAKKIFGKVAG